MTEQTPSRHSEEPLCPPFLKWAGGKRWIAKSIASLLRTNSGTYFEPFAGSAAVFFALAPRKAVLSDINPELIAAFSALRNSPEKLGSYLRRLRICLPTFKVMRSQIPKSTLERGARLVYLNRTAFNGLYRVNRLGQFNVPFGCKAETTLFEQELLARCARILRGATLVARDFQTALAEVRANDCVFADPPYTVTHNENCFRRYNERYFSWKDQVALSSRLHALAKKGVDVVITNANHRKVKDLYSSRYFSAISVKRPSNMAANSSHRSHYRELLLVSASLRERLSTLRDDSLSRMSPRIQSLRKYP